MANKKIKDLTMQEIEEEIQKLNDAPCHGGVRMRHLCDERVCRQQEELKEVMAELAKIKAGQSKLKKLEEKLEKAKADRAKANAALDALNNSRS